MDLNRDFFAGIQRTGEAEEEGERGCRRWLKRVDWRDVAKPISPTDSSWIPQIPQPRVIEVQTLIIAEVLHLRTFSVSGRSLYLLFERDLQPVYHRQSLRISVVSCW